ncbi:MAG: hypothetical protein GC183_04055 [Thiobacillus sp.]|nr:hypothetical protein [Thiobacillus sp.]
MTQGIRPAFHAFPSMLAGPVCSTVNDDDRQHPHFIYELAGELERETCDLTAAVGRLSDGLRSDHDLDAFGPMVWRLYVTASALGHSA